MKTIKLGLLTDITIGRTPSRSDVSLWDTKKETNNIWLSIADLLKTDGKIVNSSKEFITDKAANAFAQVPKGTLLVSFKLTLGRLAFAGQDLRTNEAIAALHNDERVVINEYLYYYLQCFDWNCYASADQKVKGLTLNKAKLYEIPVIYPESRDEQLLIVQKLNDAFEKIDHAINLTQQKLDDLRLLKKVALDQSLQGESDEAII